MSASEYDIRLLLAEIGGHLSEDEHDAAARKASKLKAEILRARQGGGGR